MDEDETTASLTRSTAWTGEVAALVVGVVAKVIIFLAQFWYVTVPVVATLSAVPLAGVINRCQIIEN